MHKKEIEMTKENLSFKSDFGEILYSLYIPKNYNQCIVQIAHGMIEERGKYDEFAQFLSSCGYVVAVNDHRGHGESIGGRSGKYVVSLGEMGENGFERAVRDMYALTQILKKRFEGFRFILIGHSMGSLLARRYLQLYEKELDALVLMGTPSPNALVGFGMSLCSILEYLGLKRLGVRIMNRLSLTGFNRQFRQRDASAPFYAWLTRDLKQAEPYMQKKEYRFSFTLNSFGCLFGGLKSVFSPDFRANKINLPIVFLSGDDDPCGDFGTGALRAYKYLVSQGYENVQLRLYSGARHELLLEINKKQVMQEVKEWIECK